MNQVPLFDFDTPWIALIQLALMFVLPTLVGLVTDRLAASWVKAALLGGLTFASTTLTTLLDTMLAGTEYDWVNMIVNGLITWALAIAAYLGILKPTGAAEAAQASNVIQMFGPSQSRIDAEFNFDEKKAA